MKLADTDMQDINAKENKRPVREYLDRKTKLGTHSLPLERGDQTKNIM